MPSQKQVNIGGYSLRAVSSNRARRLSLRQSADGIVLTKPRYINWYQAKRFAYENIPWIQRHYRRPLQLHSNMVVGRSHQLRISYGKHRRKTISKQFINVQLRSGDKISDNEVQDFLHKASIEALRRETKTIISGRLDYWQNIMSLKPKNVTVRHNRSRWGSCSTKRNINFSLYVAQLPDNLVDYIVIHELAHLRYQHHQAEFWKFINTFIPEAKKLSKKLRDYPLHLQPS